MNVKPRFFKTPADFRKWLEKNHATASELLVGYYKRDSGKPSMTWPESVDQALCFGWIDGVRRRIDDESYSIRFTPRKARSTWSRVNINRVAELTKLELMRPAGLAAFERRTPANSSIYSFENPPRTLPPAEEAKFRKNKKAWAWFTSQAPSYQRVCIFWITNAKKEETRQRRLALLIEDSSHERLLAAYSWSKKKK